MHPAVSVIFFTVSSGAGYGLLAAAGIAAALGQLRESPGLGLGATSLGLVLVTAGLLSSTFHLGRPERAWRAVTQWRSSWLSREGVAALLTYLPAGLLWLGLALGRGDGALTGAAGLLTALAAAATVWCTGKIYAVLKPIREWHTPWTVPVYLACAASTGLALWAALLALSAAPPARNGWLAVALLALAAAAVAKRGWHAFLAQAPAPATREAAIGLEGRGTVRVLAPPHTGSNYLLDEMGYRIGRRHAARLGAIMWGAGAVAGLLLLGALAFPLLALPAAALLLLATAIERWLFFATATHTVTLYYR